MISIKNYFYTLWYRLKTKIDVDSEFYEESCFRLYDLESD